MTSNLHVHVKPTGDINCGQFSNYVVNFGIHELPPIRVMCMAGALYLTRKNLKEKSHSELWGSQMSLTLGFNIDLLQSLAFNYYFL